MSSNNLLGKRIERLRIEKGLTQEELGKIFQVKRETVSYWEHGYREIKASQLVELAKFFDVSTDYLLGVSDIKDYDVDLKAASQYLGISEKATRDLRENISMMFEFKSFYGDYDKRLLEAYTHKTIDSFFSTDIEFFRKLIGQIVTIRELQDMDIIRKQGMKIAYPENKYNEKIEYEEFVTNKLVWNGIKDISESIGIVYSFQDYLNEQRELSNAAEEFYKESSESLFEEG